MARRRPNMSDRLSGPAPDTTDNVTPIIRGRDAFTAEAAPATATGTAVEVSVDLIDPSPQNPRSSLGDLKELAASIKELGVLQPILVRPNGDRYDLIYGHRRLAATKLAKRATVPVLFAGQEDGVKDHETRLVENLHREDLSPLDEARAYQQLLALGVAKGQRGLAKRIQVPQTRISRRLALLQLPAEVQEQLDSQRISLNDATALTKLNDDPERLARAIKDAPAWGVEKAVTRQVTAAKKEAERQAKLDELRAAGVSIIEDAQPYSDEDGPVPLRRLPFVDVEQHAQGNCHAATADRWGDIVLLCVNPQAHRDTEANDDAGATNGADRALLEQRDREQAEREAEREARYQARAERWKFAAGLVTKGDPANGAALAVHQWLVPGSYLSVDDEAVAELLDLKPDTFNGKDAADAVRAYVGKGTRNAQRAVYAIAVALAEASLGGETYYETEHDFVRQQAYFHHLVAAGYQLSRFDHKDLEEITQALADLEAELVDDDAESQGGEA